LRPPQFLVAASVILVAAVPAGAGLTEAPRLAAVYDTILAARFDEAERRLSATCPPAPAEACQAVRAVAMWWRIVLDPNSRAFDARFERAAAAAISAADAWTAREPRRAEAWFYLAGSYAPRAQWRVLRGERLAAAREGKRIKDALERALTLDPSLEDAHFGIGLYRYYADVAPAAVKLIRWLLLLPGGDRAQGLRDMLQARDRGELLKGEADFQLHWLYVWYEGKPDRTLDLLRGLDARFPSNPVFLQRIAEVQAEYLHDHAASGATWQALLDRSRTNTMSAPRLAETRARLGLAETSIALGQPERAIDQLKAVMASGSSEPYSAQAIAHLLLGHAYDRLEQRNRAVAQYGAALAAAPDDDPARVRARARAGLRRKF
jgi:tetratricopeptide (TPR) repeat protein